VPVADAPGHRSDQLGVRDTVEVARQVRVDHLGMPRPEQPVDLPDGVQGAAVGPVGVLLGLQVGLEDRREDQHHSHLRHAVPDRRDPQRPLLPVRFGDENPAHGVRSVRLAPRFGRQFVQPAVQPVRLDVLERPAVDPRRAVIGTTADVGPLQYVATVHLVVQRVEPIAGRSLRFGMQRLLELLNLRWRW
jgi:hypothetical protein